MLDAALYSPAKKCNLCLNQKGFYGDENIDGLWPGEALCLFWDWSQTLALALRLDASSVMQIELMFYSASTDERINVITRAGDDEDDAGKQSGEQRGV